ncbi:hypothetical protein ELAN111203_17180 [Elizabethkingia anophelis]
MQIYAENEAKVMIKEKIKMFKSNIQFLKLATIHSRTHTLMLFKEMTKRILIAEI